MAKIDENELRKTINVLKPNNQLFEVRIIDGKQNSSGYFTNADTLIKELNKNSLKDKSNIYITLNEVNEACYSRKQRDKFVDYASTTSDSDIDGMEWLMVDIDPKRPSGTSSSDKQIISAKEKAQRIFQFMKMNSWYEPIIAMSGNGFHLLYKVHLENSKENVELMKNCLKSLATLFNDKESDVDEKTFNPARICKLYGTLAQKGTNTIERPFRMSRIIYIPNEIKTNDKQVVEILANLFKQDDKQDISPKYYNEKFDLEEFISKHNIAIKRKESSGSTTKYVLEECLFDSSHKAPDSAIFQLSNGAISYVCFHNSCSDKKWKDVRLMFEPNAYNKIYTPNYNKPNYQQSHFVVQKLNENEPIFKTSLMIRKEPTPPVEYIKTGIRGIDNKIHGLKKGFVSCLSGLRACGKSSLISQIIIETIQQGYKAVLFSGELTSLNTLNWLELQCAGRDNVRETQYEGFFTPTDNAKERIDNWLNEKVFIYNNNYGNKFDWIITQLEKIVNEKKVDLVILDNLMALNLSSLEGDKFARQSAFVEELESFAKASNVHIMFVAHPRKSNAFLRLEDVSGSNDIVNRVDTAFIVHRVNNDFKRLAREMFGNNLDEKVYNCDNVIEICKDRDNGTQDEFVQLYFEKSCKRLCNYRGENKYYQWEVSK